MLLPRTILGGCRTDILKINNRNSSPPTANQQYSRSLSAQDSLPPLLCLLDVNITTDSPVAESEGVSHGVPNVGPADDSDGDPNNGVENRHDLSNGSLRGDVAVTLTLRDMEWGEEKSVLPIVVMTVMQ